MLISETGCICPIRIMVWIGLVDRSVSSHKVSLECSRVPLKTQAFSLMRIQETVYYTPYAIYKYIHLKVKILH